MTTRRFTIGLVTIGSLLAIAAGWRGSRVISYPIGGGTSQKSPDGRYEAHVMNYYDENFWGNSRSWFEFEISGSSTKRLITDPIPGPAFGPRTGDITNIFWAEDSSSVRFVFPEVEIKMKP